MVAKLVTFAVEASHLECIQKPTLFDGKKTYGDVYYDAGWDLSVLLCRHRYVALSSMLDRSLNIHKGTKGKCRCLC